MAKEIKFNNTLVSGAADETLTYTRYIKDESSGKSAKELLEEKVNKTDKLGTTQLENESVTAEKLAENSVDGRKVCDGSIESRHIGNNAVSTSKIASRSVTTEKIAHDSVSRAELTPDVRSSIDKKADAEQVNNSLYDLEKKIGERFVVEGDVTNLPDEEDLTSVKESERDVLKLADRSYAPEKFSGKGYKILRRNIKPVSIAVTKIQIESAPSADGTLSFSINGKETQVAVSASTDNTTALVAQKVASVLQESMTEYEVLVDTSFITLTRKSGGSVTASVFSASTTGVVCTVTDSTKREFRNILTPIMINQPNTIYEIRYDFDLDGATIEIKEGCTLKFDGGSLENGKIVGNHTSIQAPAIKIFNTDLNVFGTYNLKYSMPEWYGMYPDDLNCDLSLCFDNLNRFNTIINFSEGKYYTSRAIKLIKAKGTINKTYIIRKADGSELYTAYIGNIDKLSSENREEVEIDGLSLIIDGVTNNITSSFALLVGACENSCISNCRFSSYYTGNATDVSESLRVSAALNDNKDIEKSFNGGIKIIGTIDSVVFINTVCSGIVGINISDNADVDSCIFNQLFLIGSPRGYAGIIGNGGCSSVTFTNLSINQYSYGIKLYGNANGLSIYNGRQEQSVIIKDSEDNVLGANIYVKGKETINISIYSYYIDNSVNCIYLDNSISTSDISATFCNLYCRNTSFGNKLKYSFVAKTKSLSSCIHTMNCIFPNAEVILSGLEPALCTHIEIDSELFRNLKNCLLAPGYSTSTEYKYYNKKGDIVSSEFMSRGNPISIRFTKRLKDCFPRYISVKLSGMLAIYSSQDSSSCSKLIPVTIIIDYNGNIITNSLSTENDIEVTINEDLTLTISGALLGFTGTCEFYSAQY